MEKQSKIAWVLVNARSADADGKWDGEKEQENEETVSKMLTEAFMPGKRFKLFLCGAIIEDKDGTLEEMEEGLELVQRGMEDYKVGDYGIISTHEEGTLLFMPTDADSISTELA